MNAPILVGGLALVAYVLTRVLPANAASTTGSDGSVLGRPTPTPAGLLPSLLRPVPGGGGPVTAPDPTDLQKAAGVLQLAGIGLGLAGAVTTLATKAAAALSRSTTPTPTTPVETSAPPASAPDLATFELDKTSPTLPTPSTGLSVADLPFEPTTTAQLYALPDALDLVDATGVAPVFTMAQLQALPDALDLLDAVASSAATTAPAVSVTAPAAGGAAFQSFGEIPGANLLTDFFAGTTGWISELLAPLLETAIIGTELTVGNLVPGVGTFLAAITALATIPGDYMFTRTREAGELGQLVPAIAGGIARATTEAALTEAVTVNIGLRAVAYLAGERVVIGGTHLDNAAAQDALSAAYQTRLALIRAANAGEAGAQRTLAGVAVVAARETAALGEVYTLVGGSPAYARGPIAFTAPDRPGFQAATINALRENAVLAVRDNNQEALAVIQRAVDGARALGMDVPDAIAEARYNSVPRATEEFLQSGEVTVRVITPGPENPYARPATLDTIPDQHVTYYVGSGDFGGLVTEPLRVLAPAPDAPTPFADWEAFVVAQSQGGGS